MSTRPTLVLTWGNPGRQDDGLGPAFARELERSSLEGVSIATDYQLQVEDAADLAGYERVVFVDADREGVGPFWVRRLAPAGNGMGFSTHSVSPAALLTLARNLFDAEPEAWLVGIRGYEFDEFGERLSERARANLAEAVAYIEAALRSSGMRETGIRRSLQSSGPHL